MVFSNLFFIYAFLPACLFLYYIVPTMRAKNAVLLMASLVFYAMGEPVYVLVLIASAASAFALAFPLAQRRGTAQGRLLLALSVAVTVSFLFVFKYAKLFAATANQLFGLALPVPDLSLPVGISFFTFQILTYTVDVYRGKTAVQSSPLQFLLYVSLFPQLIAGPIVRYGDVEAQLAARKPSLEKFSSGLILFVCGLAKKIILADRAGKIASELLGASDAAQAVAGANLTTLGAWVGLLAFTFQIYFDFSGYSDMAIGLGRLFGFEFKKNFDHPYASLSVTEFWRRWHISLGTFFRDYVYIPLGGNRRLQLRNIAIVWVLTGFWHGASWNFVLWGAYYGALLIVEKYVFSKIKIPLLAPARWLYTFFAAVFGWALFYFADFDRLRYAVQTMFSPAWGASADLAALSAARENALFFAVCLVASMPWAANVCERLRGGARGGAVLAASSLVYALGLLAVCSVIMVGSTFSPFLYYRF